MGKTKAFFVASIVLGFASLSGFTDDRDTFEGIGESIDDRVDAVRDTVEDAIDEAEQRLEDLDE